MDPIAGLYESIDTVPLDEWNEVCRTTPTCFLEPEFLRPWNGRCQSRLAYFTHLFASKMATRPLVLACVCTQSICCLWPVRRFVTRPHGCENSFRA